MHLRLLGVHVTISYVWHPLKSVIEIQYEYRSCITLYIIIVAYIPVSSLSRGVAQTQVQTVCSWLDWVMIFTTQLQAAPTLSYTHSFEYNLYVVANCAHSPLSQLLWIDMLIDLQRILQCIPPAQVYCAEGLHFSAFIFSRSLCTCTYLAIYFWGGGGGGWEVGCSKYKGYKVLIVPTNARECTERMQ